MRGGRRNAAPIGVAASRSDHRAFRSGGGFRRSARHKSFPHAVLPPPLPPLPPPPPPPALRRHHADVLLEAGRLAAEYLVAKGLLPAGSLPPWAAGRRWRNGGGEAGKTSALGRRRVDDDDGSAGPRKRARRRRHRSGSYNCHGAEWGRENGRGGPWTPDAWADGGRCFTDAVDDDGWDPARRWSDRNKGSLDTVDGDDSDRQNGSEEGGSGDGVCGKEPLNGVITDKVFLPSNSEVTGELELEQENRNLGDDTGSKAMEDCEGKMETVPEAEMVSKTSADDIRVLDLETEKVEKVKVSIEEDQGNMLQLEEEDDLGVKLCPDMEDKEVSNHGGISLLRGFSKLPTKRRSSVTNKNSRTDQEVGIEGVRENSDVTLKERGLENTAEEVSVLGPSNDLPTNQCQSGRGLAYEISTLSTSSALLTKPPQSPRGVVPKISRSQSVQLVESVEHCLTMDVGSRKCGMSHSLTGSYFVHRQQETSVVPPGFELRRTPTDAGIGEDLANHKEEGIKQTRGWSPSHLSKMDEPFQNSKSNQLNISTKELSPDLKIVDAIEEHADVFPEAVVKYVDTSEEQRQLASSSFKILDLNLMEAPETTDISDDHLPEHVTTSLKTENNTSADFGLLICQRHDDTDLNILHSNDGKTVPVIDLEDDSPVGIDGCGTSRAKSEPVHPNLENFMNHPENPVGLPNIQDGYGLAISEFLGNDIAGCPAVQGDISNLQAFDHAEGITGNDDSLYANLGELPINFMKVWDQPPPEYEKFF